MCGSRDGLMTVTGRKHNADDIIATVLAVEPMRFIYRGRIAVFSTRVLRDERICVIAEQRPECSEEEVGWLNEKFAVVINKFSLNRVSSGCPVCYKLWTQYIKSGSIVWPSCRRIICPRHLWVVSTCPRRSADSWKGLCIQPTSSSVPIPVSLIYPSPGRFIQASFRTSTLSQVTLNLITVDIGPASVIVGNLVQGNRLASAQGRDMGLVDEESDSGRKVSKGFDKLKGILITISSTSLFPRFCDGVLSALQITFCSAC